MQAQPEPFRFLRLPEVRRVTGLSRSQIYRLEATGQFPKHVKLGASASAWVDREIAQWQVACIASRDVKGAA
jgi:prophage regulatory protein